jgi:hypothetical protein
MKRLFLSMAAAGAFASVSQAQTSPLITQFQQAGELSVTADRVLINVGPRAEIGKPYSATVIDETTQTYADGTHINRRTTTFEARDSDGRMRREVTTTGPNGQQNQSVMIQDPVAGYNYRLNPAAKTGTQVQLPNGAGRGGRGAGGTVGSNSVGVAPANEIQARVATLPADTVTMQAQAAKNAPSRQVEDLGTTMVNGVVAQGTRVTRVTPVNTIGNDREIRSATEEWYSPDLNLMVRTISTDPRFGTTRHELTNISRASPDPTLFMPPADYKMTAGGGRRGPQN